VKLKGSHQVEQCHVEIHIYGEAKSDAYHQFVAFADFRSFHSLLQYKETQLTFIHEIQVLQTKGQDIAYLFLLSTAAAQSCKYQTALCIKLHSEHNQLCA
jgi:hypothetical protein